MENSSHTRWFKNGQNREQTYKDGKMHGTYKEWHPMVKKD